MTRRVAARMLVHRLGGPGDFEPLLERARRARVVLLGEASHGTYDYYRLREQLTRRLIAECGYSFVAVEGDWPDCDRVHRSVTAAPGGQLDPQAALRAVERWPTWMWANAEVARFCRWLRAWNLDRPPGQRAGFHGLDVYSLWESMRAIFDYLGEEDPAALEAAQDAYRCFEPYGKRLEEYGMASRFVSARCEEEVIRLLARTREQAAADGAERFAAWQNAEVIARAERYYRALVGGGPQSWNVRDTHMADTLDRLLEHYGTGRPVGVPERAVDGVPDRAVDGVPDRAVDGVPDRAVGIPRAVVWAHNTHIGDARATEMADSGMVNLGQLVRERYGPDGALLVGFGSYHGNVIAAPRWGAPPEVMMVPAARQGSLEHRLHELLPERALLLLDQGERPEWSTERVEHRAIGVVYDPSFERWGNYVPTVLAQRYDAFIWCDQTSALHPLPARVSPGEMETYPAGV